MAKTVNLGDKYTHRVTLRLTDSQFQYIVSSSDQMGVSPSEYMRQILEHTISLREVGTHEDVKADFNDIL